MIEIYQVVGNAGDDGRQIDGEYGQLDIAQTAQLFAACRKSNTQVATQSQRDRQPYCDRVTDD